MVPRGGGDGPDGGDRVGAVSGILSASVGLLGLAAAIAISPWFSWTANALSDLGHPRHDSWVVFGASLVIAGSLAAAFAWALLRRLPRGPLGAVAVLFLIAGGLSLAGVGAVNESFGFPHLLLSVTYFAFEAAGIGVVGIAMWRTDRRWGALSFAAGAVSGAFAIMVSTAMAYGAPFPSQAIPELIASLVFSVWIAWMGWALWRGAVPAGGERPGAPPPG